MLEHDTPGGQIGSKISQVQKTNKKTRKSAWFPFYARSKQAQFIVLVSTVVVITAGERRYEEVMGKDCLTGTMKLQQHRSSCGYSTA